MRDRFNWARLLALVTGLVNQELLLRNEYVATENRILRSKLPNRLRLTDPERVVFAEIAKRLGRKALNDIARVAKPDTILGWYRRLIAQKFDGSRHRAGATIALPGRSETWVTWFQIRPSAISCGGTGSHLRPSGAGRPRGRSSSGRIWTCLPAQTSLPSRC